MMIGQYVTAEQCYVMVISLDMIHAARYVSTIEETECAQIYWLLCKKWYGHSHISGTSYYGSVPFQVFSIQFISYHIASYIAGKLCTAI